MEAADQLLAQLQPFPPTDMLYMVQCFMFNCSFNPHKSAFNVLVFGCVCVCVHARQNYHSELQIEHMPTMFFQIQMSLQFLQDKFNKLLCLFSFCFFSLYH